MLAAEVKIQTGIWKMKERVKDAVHDFFTTEEGDTNFISIIIVLVIVVALAIVFRENIAKLVNGMWTKIFGDAGEATGATIEGQSSFQ